MTFTYDQILKWSQGTLVNEDSLVTALTEVRVERIASLGLSQPTDLAFFFSKAFQSELPLARPGILIIAESCLKDLKQAGLPFWSQSPVLVCQDPYFIMASLSEKFAAQLSTVAHIPIPPEKRGAVPASSIDPTARIALTAKIGKGVRIGPYCVVEDNAEIGDRTLLYAGCFIGPNAKLGEDTVLFPRVVIYEDTVIGNRVRLHAGCVLGSDGFGYALRMGPGRMPLGHQKIYHLGNVVVEDDVEIGANSCADRGTFSETRIGAQAKLDNLVHLGHNTRVDTGAILCGGVFLAGNASVGKFAYIGGMTGLTNQVHVGDGAKVGANSLVSKDVPPGGTAVGTPQREHKEHFKVHALLNRMLSERKKDG